MRVERHATNLPFVADQFGHTLPRIHVPDVGSAVETAGHYFVAKWVVERECLDDVFMPQECIQFSPVVCVLQFTSPVLRTSDEPSSIFIETNIW